jgi:hypothetical protein
MNCTCVQDIEKKFIGIEFGEKKKKINKATLTSSALLFGDNKLTRVTCSVIDLEVEGYKRTQSHNMIHSFCPFCGVKIEK